LILQTAEYSVWFRTPEGEGYGVISLFLDGDVCGSDTISCCTGTYVQDGDKFAATIAVRRHTQRPPSVFGVDTIGQIDADNGGVFGTAKQAPGTTFQATLIRIVDR
jgi:hypothetical protein